MLNLSLKELKLIAKSRVFKRYKRETKERLLSALDESESANTRIKKFKSDGFFKSKIKEIRKNIDDIKTKKNLSKSKINEIEQNLIELEQSLFKLNSYFDYDDTKYQEIRGVANLFNGVALNGMTDEDYYKPIWTKSAFNGNYIEYESKGDKNKN